MRFYGDVRVGVALTMPDASSSSSSSKMPKRREGGAAGEENSSMRVVVKLRSSNQWPKEVEKLVKTQSFDAVNCFHSERVEYLGLDPTRVGVGRIVPHRKRYLVNKTMARVCLVHDLH